MCTHSHHQHDTITSTGSHSNSDSVRLAVSAQSLRRRLIMYRPRLEVGGFLSAQRVVADVTRARRRSTLSKEAKHNWIRKCCDRILNDSIAY